MKKFITICLALLSVFTIWAESAKGYYEQDARKSDNILIFSSKVTGGQEDGSDVYLGDVVRKQIISDLQIYSNYNVIDFFNNETFKSYQKAHPEVTDNNYLIENVTKDLEAKYAVEIETTIDRSQSQETVGIMVTLFLPAENAKINGYTSAISWNRNEYLEFAHRDASFALLPQIDITLTSLGERLLLETAPSVSMTLEDAIAEEEDINLQFSRTSKKSNSKAAQNIVKIQLDQAKEKVRELTKRQQQDEDERIAATKRSQETIDWINETSAKNAKNLERVLSEKFTGLSIENQINVIESKKQILLDNKNFVNEKIAVYNAKQDVLKVQEQEERKNRAPAAGEVDAFGNLNESARIIQQKDLIIIDKKYEDAKVKYAEETKYYYQNVQDKVAKQINDDVKALESKTYTANSISDKNFIFHIDYYDGDKHGWMYTISFDYDGKNVFSAENLIDYKTITGSKAPSTSELIVAKVKENYNATVDKYNSLFRNKSPFLNAKVYYKVLSEDYTKPSEYKVVISKIEIENLVTGKIIETLKPAKPLNFEYVQVTDVDWRTSAMVTTEIQKIEDKKESQKNRMERIDRQSKRLTWGGLILIPSVWNYYKTENDSFQTLGYTLSIGLNNYTYVAVTAEIGDLKAIYDLKNDFINQIKDFEFTYTAAGQLGLTYKVFNNMRLNAFVECGQINKEFGYGAGVSTDINLGKLGILAGYTKCHNDTDKWMNKFTAGFEFVF